MSTRWDTWFAERASDRRLHQLNRSLEPIEWVSSVEVRRRERTLILFSSNDYLGLSAHPDVRRAAIQATTRCGNGPRGSALVCGHTHDHERLAQALARLKQTERAVLFPSGFAANAGALAALADPDTAIFSDALNHASLIDGARLAKRSGADVIVYRHGDMAHLASALASHSAPRKIIVSDAVFSMDGDWAPLADLVTLKEQHDALLLLDEAHSTLIYGTTGSGLSHKLGLAAHVDVHVGTLSKAFGAQGGFIAGTTLVCDHVVNHARSLVYSTALPAPTVAAAHAALTIAQTEPALRKRLWAHVDTLSDALDRPFSSPIISIVLGDAHAALNAAEHLSEAGMHVVAIRPPTVPPLTARLRIALSAAHEPHHIDRLITALERMPHRA